MEKISPFSREKKGWNLTPSFIKKLFLNSRGISLLDLDLEAFWFHFSILEKEWKHLFFTLHFSKKSESIFFHFALLEKEWKLFVFTFHFSNFKNPLSLVPDHFGSFGPFCTVWTVWTFRTNLDRLDVVSHTEYGSSPSPKSLQPFKRCSNFQYASDSPSNNFRIWVLAFKSNYNRHCLYTILNPYIINANENLCSFYK